MEEQKKEFTGVWIPRHIMENKQLKPTDRLIYAEIASFDQCYMSNETLGERAGCSGSQASRIIIKLKSLGYIRQTKFDGRTRWLKAMLDAPFKDETTQNAQADYASTRRQTTQNADLDNNIDNNKITTFTNVNGQKPEKYGKPEINDCFLKWKEIVGYPITSKTAANRNACNNLIRKHTVEGVERLIIGVAKSQEDKFAPRISDFITLQAKQNDLLAWGKRKLTGEVKGVIRV